MFAASMSSVQQPPQTLVHVKGDYRPRILGNKSYNSPISCT